ncbi:unnamed protein product [Oikopleura dioica]|uniref:Major facilitator superfamily (MFS) profile domain-containing protein n=1 Tax=Oikopleura dioica TaxID=34765 RepID=E4XAB2_OIKDI|nr:unnamed protein product [Oikopleura dioica]
MQSFYNLSAVTVNYIPGIFSVGIIFGGLVGSPIIAKLGNRKTVFVSGVFVAIMHVFLYFIRIFNVALIAFFMISIMFGLLFMAALNQIAVYWESKRTMATQIGSCGTSVGMLLFPLIIAWLLETFTVPGYYLILAGIYLNVMIAGALMHNPHSVKKDDPIESKKETLIENEAEIMEENKVEGKSGGLFSLPEFYLYIIAQAILNGGYFAGVLYVSPFSQGAYSLTPVTAASMITLMGGAELLFRIPIGILSDKPWINRHYFLAFNCLNLALSFYLLPQMPSYMLFGAMCMFSGAFQGGWGGLSFVTLADFLKVVKLEKQLMAGVGLSTAFNGISCMIVSVGMGKIVDATGSYELPFFIGAGMVAMAGVLSGLIGIISARRSAIAEI